MSTRRDLAAVSGGQGEDAGPMSTPAASLFCDIELAGRVERAEVDLISAASAAARRRDATGFSTPVAGGIASFAGDRSPYNKVTGLGFDGAPTAAELHSIEQDRKSVV